LPHSKLFDRNQVLQGAKAPVADSTHHDQVFDAAKRAEPFAMFDDALRQTFSDPGKSLEFFGGRGVDIDSLRVWLIVGGNDLRLIARLLIVRLFTNRLR
jgi:hypothetical protein